MSDVTPRPAAPEEPLLDQLLREAVPEIKLALGDLIDRDNARSLPDRYARLLPETVLIVTLRPDAARSLAPVAVQLEAELTDSCMRHGSLYDRPYRVRLHEAGDPGAPLFRITKEAAGGPSDQPGLVAGVSEPEPALGTVSAPPLTPPVPPIEVRGDRIAPLPPSAHGETIAVPPPRPAAPRAPASPMDDPDATRMEGLAPPRTSPAPGWESGRWELVVEDSEGADAETFPLPHAEATVGRHTDNPALRSDLMLTGAPQVSRRHLALRWEPRDGKPGFRVANLGLNALWVDKDEVPGANLKGPFSLDAVPEQHVRWVAADARMRIGENGPALRIRPAAAPEKPAEPAEPEDPDATRFG